MESDQISSCNQAPTLIPISDNFGYSATGAIWVSSFQNMNFGGYVTSGQVYYDTICVNDFCKYMKLYAADQILEDNWNWDIDGANGILGYGPNSPFWKQYINTTG